MGIIAATAAVPLLNYAFAIRLIWLVHVRQAQAVGHAAGRHRRHVRQWAEAMLVVSGGVTSVANYGYTLVLLYMLPAGQYAVFSAIASLLLICGTVSAASTPWVVAREVAQSPAGSDRRAAAVTFGLVSVTAQGVAAGLATTLVASHYATSVVVAVVLGASVAIFVEAAGIGYLQGAERFRLIAALRVLEVAVKVVAGMLLVVTGTGAVGAVMGILVGAATAGAVSVGAMSPDLHRTKGALTDRRLWISARGLLAVQSGVAVLAGMDIVVASLTLASRSTLAAYQAAQILGRVPTFVATALSLVMFARLSKRASPGLPQDTVGLFLGLCIPVAIGIGTLPPALRGIVFPKGYGEVAAVLALVAAGGVCIGVVNLVTTIFQAVQRCAAAAGIVWLGAAVGLPADYLAIRYGGIVGLAWAVIGIGGAVSVALGVLWLVQWSVRPFPLLRRTALMALLAAPLVELRRWDAAWVAWVLVVVAPPMALALWRSGRTAAAGDGRLMVLHLGFEDPLQPGSGGGPSAPTRSTAGRRRRRDHRGMRGVPPVSATHPGRRALRAFGFAPWRLCGAAELFRCAALGLVAVPVRSGGRGFRRAVLVGGRAVADYPSRHRCGPMAVRSRKVPAIPLAVRRRGTGRVAFPSKDHCRLRGTRRRSVPA